MTKAEMDGLIEQFEQIDNKPMPFEEWFNKLEEVKERELEIYLVGGVDTFKLWKEALQKLYQKKEDGVIQ